MVQALLRHVRHMRNVGTGSEWRPEKRPNFKLSNQLPNVCRVYIQRLNDSKSHRNHNHPHLTRGACAYRINFNANVYFRGISRECLLLDTWLFPFFCFIATIFQNSCLQSLNQLIIIYEINSKVLFFRKHILYMNWAIVFVYWSTHTR